MMKCPRCQTKIDVTDLSAGSTVRCTDCGAMVRIPTGSTGVHPSVPVPAAAPAPAPAPAPSKAERSGTRSRMKRGTSLFKKMSNVKGPGEKKPSQVRAEGMTRGASGPQKNNTPMIVGICAGGLLVVVGIAFFAMSGKHDEKATKSGDTAKSDRPLPKKKKDDFGSSSKPSGTGSSSFNNPPPANAGGFQAGARGLLDMSTTPTFDKELGGLKAEYESMVTGGKIGEVVAQDHRYLKAIWDGMLSDNESVARGSFQAMHEIIKKHGIAKDVQSSLGNDPVLGGFNSAQVRVDEYGYWARWWFVRTNQNLVEKWATEVGATFNPNPSPSASPASAPAAAGEWPQIMQTLRSGGGFENQNSPEYGTFQHVKRMGKAAYPNIIAFIDNEDPAMGRAAVALLNALTGRDSKMPREDTKAAIKSEWEAWLSSNK
jgi:hypothetical protein